MNTFAFLLLAIQACFVQNVYSQYLRGAAFGPGVAANLGSPCAIEAGIAPAAFAYPAYALEAGRAGPYALEAGLAPGFAYPAGLAGAYGGSGIGDVAVAGEMGVAGTTLVAGQVPILGAVRFGGDLPAAGTVTITGNCGCSGGAVIY